MSMCFNPSVYLIERKKLLAIIDTLIYAFMILCAGGKIVPIFIITCLFLITCIIQLNYYVKSILEELTKR